MNQSNSGACPQCQTPNLYTAQFCTLCGARLPWAQHPAPVAQSTPVAPQRKPPMSIGKIIGIVVGSIVGCIFLVALFVILVLTVLGSKPITNTFDQETKNMMGQ
jgi:uncharacterized membrane protein YvbJ